MNATVCKSCGMTMPCECCQPFTGSRTRDGYGIVYAGSERPQSHGKRRGRKAILAHRHAMQKHLARDLLPGEVVMHECDNPPCIFLGHLRVATQAENLADMRAKGRGHVPAPRRGSANPRTKLTVDQVLRIRARKGAAVSRIVGVEFGVSAALIRDIWLGRAWRHVA